jgi:ABC-2 type transport system ATP-binding protein
MATPPLPQPEPALAVACRGVTKRYGGVTVVDNIDLDVAAGEIVGLLGANGAGKTTLMRAICGLVKPTSGEVHLLGRPIPLPPAEAKRIGAALDTPAFYPWMTARSLLRTLLDTSNVADEGRVADALARVGLAGTAKKKIKKFSMGMRQRLALATALVRRPAVLILDEPMNGLDPDGVRLVRALLNEQRQAGTAVLVSSHQMDEMQRLCDRLVLVDEGRVLARGTPQELGVRGERTLEDTYFSLREAGA